MILKIGSTGENVRLLQEVLGLVPDGNFGPKTELAVKAYQTKNKMVVDGIVGPKTWKSLIPPSSDSSESVLDTGTEFIQKQYLPKGEYHAGPTKKEYLFLHHTAGWNNPGAVISDWSKDTRGTIATEFVIGGPSIKGDTKYDGKIVQAFPAGGYAWHLGANGSQYMHKHSVGIEVCNFGQLYDIGDSHYAWPAVNKGQLTASHNIYKVPQNQVYPLKFRGFSHWHRYSNIQIDALKNLILYIAERDSIDVRKGLVEQIHKVGALKAFDYNENAFYGKTKGMWSHTNTRKDKFDMFPQSELVDMLISL